MESDAEGIFNIAYNRRINLLELADIIMNYSGIHVNPIFESPRGGDVKDSLAEISAAQKAFGYQPKYNVKMGLESNDEIIIAGVSAEVINRW